MFENSPIMSNWGGIGNQLPNLLRIPKKLQFNKNY